MGDRIAQKADDLVQSEEMERSGRFSLKRLLQQIKSLARMASTVCGLKAMNGPSLVVQEIVDRQNVKVIRQV